MQYDVTPIVNAVIGLCALVITTFLIPMLKTKLKELKAKYTNLTDEQIDYWISVAVRAAEQIFVSIDGAKRGAEKKQYVLNWLKERNIYIDENVLDAKIESEVYKLKHDITTINS